jgi:hypothetical protein
MFLPGHPSDFLGDSRVSLGGSSSRFRGRHFLPPNHRGRHSRSGLVHHSFSMSIDLYLFADWGRSAPPERLDDRFFAAWRLGARSAVQVPLFGPRLPSSLLLAAVGFLCRGLLPLLQTLFLPLTLCGPRVVQGICDGQTVQWPWQSLAGIPRPIGSSFLVDCGKRRQNVGIRNGLPGLEGHHKSRLSGFRAARRWPCLARRDQVR